MNQRRRDVESTDLLILKEKWSIFRGLQHWREKLSTTFHRCHIFIFFQFFFQISRSVNSKDIFFCYFWLLFLGIIVLSHTKGKCRLGRISLGKECVSLGWKIVIRLHNSIISNIYFYSKKNCKK